MSEREALLAPVHVPEEESPQEDHGERETPLSTVRINTRKNRRMPAYTSSPYTEVGWAATGYYDILTLGIFDPLTAGFCASWWYSVCQSRDDDDNGNDTCLVFVLVYMIGAHQVFFSSCNSVKFHSELLNYIDVPVMDIHGKQKQQKRTTSFFQFCRQVSFPPVSSVHV